MNEDNLNPVNNTTDVNAQLSATNTQNNVDQIINGINEDSDLDQDALDKLAQATKQQENLPTNIAENSSQELPPANQGI